MATNTIKLHRRPACLPGPYLQGMDDRRGLQQMAAAKWLPG